MGSDFRPHGCDPMGSAVGITPIAMSQVEGLEEIDEEEKDVLGKEVFGHDKPWAK